MAKQKGMKKKIISTETKELKSLTQALDKLSEAYEEDILVYIAVKKDKSKAMLGTRLLSGFNIDHEELDYMG